MDWRTSVKIFRTLSKATVQFDDTEIMGLLSIAQNTINNTFKIEKLCNLQLAKGQSLYTSGTAVTNIPIDLTDIKLVQVNIPNPPPNPQSPIVNMPLLPYDLNRVSEDKMNRLKKISGFPNNYTLKFYTKVLEIDSSPDQSYDITNYPAYMLNITYYLRTDIFDKTLAQYTSYDETKSDYGGSWLIPSEWHMAVIYGALSTIDSKKFLPLYTNEIQTIRKPIYADSDLPYSLGV